MINKGEQVEFRCYKSGLNIISSYFHWSICKEEELP